MILKFFKSKKDSIQPDKINKQKKRREPRINENKKIDDKSLFDKEFSCTTNAFIPKSPIKEKKPVNTKIKATRPKSLGVNILDRITLNKNEIA